MNEVVAELSTIVGGSSQSATRGKVSQSNRKQQLSHSDHAYHNIGGGAINRVETKATAKTHAAKAIPLNDDSNDDLNDFNS